MSEKCGALIKGRYGVPRRVNAIPRENLQRVRGISEVVSCPFSDTRAVYRGREEGGGPVVRTRRVPSERLRLVSKSHLTLTWGGVMKQHDLRFAAPCSCLIETSVAHPPFHFGTRVYLRTHARTRTRNDPSS